MVGDDGVALETVPALNPTAEDTARDSFISRMTSSTDDGIDLDDRPAEVAEESVEDDEDFSSENLDSAEESEVESEVADDEAPSEDGHPEEAAGSQEEHPEGAGPESEQAEHPRKYAGKYATIEQFESSHAELQRTLTQTQQSAAMMQHELETLRGRQAQTPVRYEQLSKEDREYWERLGEDYEADPRDLYVQHQVAQRQNQHIHEQQRHQRYTNTLNEVMEFATSGKFSENEQFIANKLTQHGTLSLASRMPPELMGEWTKSYIEDMDRLAKLEKEVARHKDAVEAARRAGIEEARQAKSLKKEARTAAGSATARRPGAPSKSKMLQQLLASQDSGGYAY